MSNAAENLTPMLRQYLEIKEQHQDAILFFRLGDFYEMFFEDAVRASELLEITLTSRNKNAESSIPLCGVPYHSAAAYIRKLIENGMKVAICEQVEDPKSVKGIVKREVTRVITPGLLVEEEGLVSSEANYLAALSVSEGVHHLSFLDISTGEVLAGTYEQSDLAMQELLKHRVKELVVEESEEARATLTKVQKVLPALLVSAFPAGEGSVPKDEIVTTEFRESLAAVKSPNLAQLLAKLLSYVHATQRSRLRHLSPVQVLRERQVLGMDHRTFRHLELTQNARGEGRGGTLFWVLNQTRTSMGARMLRKWIHYPLMEIREIERRQAAIADFLEKGELLFQIQEELKGVQDIERMLGKLALGTVHARDLYSLGQSLKSAQELIAAVQPQLGSELCIAKAREYPALETLFREILSTLQSDLPLTIREGGMIAEGIHPELDELRAISRDGKSFIAAMEEKERKRTGVSSLKIRYNKVFGYYIEITHTHKDSVPPDYIRKQTLANAERFITPELKDYESKVLSAEERIKNLEYSLFCKLRDAASAELENLKKAADILSTLDVLAALARVARDQRYVRPRLSEERVLILKESRHPVLEVLHRSERFIPNDLEMEEGKGSLFLITGPNMAGKSTVMRQAALMVVLAQMGSYVPAEEATIGIVDQLFTRIGASDDLSQGQSTFMVEMLETASILKQATERSFIVLDEIGRGTSTYDGMSIAWAVAECVAKNIGCRALFATHYHELIELSQSLPKIVNYQVAVKEWNGQILFLRKLIPGGASRSYGIEVARLAGLPESLLDRAREVLKGLEKIEGAALAGIASPRPPTPQMNLFAPVQDPVLEELKNVEPDTMSPLEALNFLFELKKKIKKI